MAQMTHLVSFGPVFCPYPFPTLLALSSIALGHCYLFFLAIFVVMVVVIVIVVVVVVVVVVMPCCRVKDIYKIIF